MNETLKPQDLIRDYLLGRVSDEDARVQIEELLFTDDDFCLLAEMTEDALLDDLVFDRLDDEGKADLLRSLENNPARRNKLMLARALNERAAEPALSSGATAPTIYERLKALFSQPVAIGAFAVLLAAILIGSIVLIRRPKSDELADLKNIYKKERPVEPRLNGFDYAPLTVTRGENTSGTDKNAIELEKTKFLRAVVENPTAATFHRLGVFYLTQQDYPPAIENLGKAARLDNKDASIQNDLGSAYFEFAKSGVENRLLNLGRANEAFSKALELDPNYLEALFNKALTLQDIPLRSQAKATWELYLQKDPSSKWADEARKYLEKLLTVETGSKKTKEEIFNDFWAAYKKGDEAIIWSIHNSTKGLLRGVSPAEQLTQRYIEARKTHDAETAKELIGALMYIGDLEKEKHADFFFADLAEFYTKTDKAQTEDISKAQTLFADGYAYVVKNNAELAIRTFDESARHYRLAHDVIEADLATGWSAQMLIDTGNIAESSRRMELLREDADQKRYRIISANLNYWIGNCDSKQREYSRAIRNTNTALAIARETENAFEIQHSAENLAEMYNTLGELEKSLANITYAIGNTGLYYVTPSQTWRSINTTSDLFVQLDDFSTAVDFATEAVRISIDIAPKADLVNDSMQYLVTAMTKAGQLSNAVDTADLSNKLALARERNPQNNKTVADTFLSRAELKREMGDCENALADYQSAIDYYSGLTEVIQDLHTLHKGKLLCFENLKRPDDFRSELAVVLGIYEELRKSIREDDLRQTFFDNEQDVFEAAIGNALDRSDKRKAFEYVENSRARSLLEFVKSGKSIAEVEDDFSSVSRPLDIRQIQADLPANVQIVEYQVLKDKLATWVITKERFDLIEKEIASTEFEALINEYRMAVIARESPQNLHEIAARLYMIVVPGDLEPGKAICFVPDGPLNKIPFASLVSSAGRYLIEDYALLYSPSASVFVSAYKTGRSKERLGETLLSIGNPEFDRAEHPTLKDLPEAAIEAGSIAGEYARSKTLLAGQATKKEFLDGLKGSGVVHFAGHFVVNERSAGNSKMIFADSDLRSFELSDYKLPNLKLVVLSACETGFERFDKSEGAIGVARTFLAIGSPIVIASNWKVDSDASRQLMIAFHKKRKLEHISSVEALRQSQLEMLRSPDTSAPFYWAAFSATGGLTSY